jgi:hypothetical protein
MVTTDHPPPSIRPCRDFSRSRGARSWATMHAWQCVEIGGETLPGLGFRFVALEND